MIHNLGHKGLNCVVMQLKFYIKFQICKIYLLYKSIKCYAINHLKPNGSMEQNRYNNLTFPYKCILLCGNVATKELKNVNKCNTKVYPSRHQLLRKRDEVCSRPRVFGGNFTTKRMSRWQLWKRPISCFPLLLESADC